MALLLLFALLAGAGTALSPCVLPVLPALLSAALIVFVTSAGLFDVPLALASPRGIRFMPTEIFSLVGYPSDLGRAAAFGIVVLTVTILLTLLQRNEIPVKSIGDGTQGLSEL